MEWKVRFTVRYKNGTDIPDREEIVEAPTIRAALDRIDCEESRGDHSGLFLSVEFLSVNPHEPQDQPLGYRSGRIL
jgi:hypothetical protein